MKITIKGKTSTFEVEGTVSELVEFSIKAVIPNLKEIIEFVKLIKS